VNITLLYVNETEKLSLHRNIGILFDGIENLIIDTSYSSLLYKIGIVLFSEKIATP
jgi:hypothetical protein